MGKIIIAVDPDLQDLVAPYLESRRNEVPLLLQMISESDFEKIQKIAHKIRGSAGGYGFEGLTQFAGQLESAAKEKNLDKIKEQMNDIQNYLNSVELQFSA